MKKIALIICEYNPFHNGHRLHIEKTRAAGAETVICLMSGNYVQRGELALCEKSLRAEAAVRCGADLVLELPFPFVLSGARYFAEGAAEIARLLDVDATLSFGAAVRPEQLAALRSEMNKTEVKTAVSALCASAHYSYPRALQTVLETEKGPSFTAPLKDPNSLLALEYLQAFESIAPRIDFFAVPREAACGHDKQKPSENFASAMYIRALFSDHPVREALRAAAVFVPAESLSVLARGAEEGRLPLRRDIFSAAAMTRLLSLDAEALRQTNGVRQGLENRILSAIRTENDLYALFDAVKSKRYTHAGIRQAVLSAVFGITREDLSAPLPYLRVLGMNERGRSFLREQKASVSCPVVMNLSEARESRLKMLDEAAGKLAAFCRPDRRITDAEYQVKPFVLCEPKS